MLNVGKLLPIFQDPDLSVEIVDVDGEAEASWEARASITGRSSQET